MRRKSIHSDSLELFLDTICNTFGGILFIALLVIVLLQMTSKKTSVSIQEEIVKESEYRLVELEYNKLQVEWAGIQDMARQIKETNDQFSSESLKKAYTQWQDKKRLYEQKLEYKSSLLAEVLTVNREVGTVQSGLLEKEKERDELKKNLQQAEEEFDRKGQTRAKRQTLPQMRQSNKEEVAMIIRFERLYLWHHYNVNGKRTGLNTDDFVIVDSDGEDNITLPKIQGGIDLKNPEAVRQIQDKLALFSADQVKLSIIIWPDSYNVWPVVQNYIVGKGFNYTPIPTDEKYIWVDRGGPNRDVL